MKERATAGDLACFIRKKLDVAGLEVMVRRDHAYGWVPTIVSAPGDPIYFQRQADDIAHKLRARFDLAE